MTIVFACQATPVKRRGALNPKGIKRFRSYLPGGSLLSFAGKVLANKKAPLSGAFSAYQTTK
jgi:hypothetical protein